MVGWLVFFNFFNCVNSQVSGGKNVHIWPIQKREKCASSTGVVFLFLRARKPVVVVFYELSWESIYLRRFAMRDKKRDR
jgi:hypothetical protein